MAHKKLPKPRDPNFVTSKFKTSSGVMSDTKKQQTKKDRKKAKQECKGYT